MPLHKAEQSSPAPVNIYTDGSEKSRSSSFVKYLHRKRLILSILAVLIIIGMAIGLLFVAHFYYHEWGGQGFLRSRTMEEALDSFFDDGSRITEAGICLPMRKIADIDPDRVFLNIGLQHDPELRRAISTESPTKSSPNNTYPFFVCGDQAQDCEAYGQPNICCPVDFLCHSTSKKITSSGIYCCHFNSSAADCESTASHKPKCSPGYFECPSFSGGGCCPDGSACLNQTTATTTMSSIYPVQTKTKLVGGGCALYMGNSGGELLTTTTTTETTPTPTSSGTWTPDYSNIIEQSTTSYVSTSDPDAPTKTGGPAGGSTTATFLGSPTGTTVREGEVAQIGIGVGLRGSRVFKALLSIRSPGSTWIWLGLVAGGFWFLG